MLNDLENIYVIGKHHLIDKLTHWRQRLSDVASYSITPVPLVYTQVSPSLHHTVSHCITWSQVVHLAIYVFFTISLISDQWIISTEECDVVIPIFTIFKFLFIFGWLRTAETLYDPFGEDDEDFNINELLERHIRAGEEYITNSMTIVDILEEEEVTNNDDDTMKSNIQDLKIMLEHCMIVKKPSFEADFVHDE